MIELVDTHAHLQLENFAGELDKIIKDARRVGVGKIIVPGIDVQSGIDGVKLSKHYDCLFPAVGIHPHEAKDVGGTQMRQIRNLIETNRKEIIAVGECGLDYHYNNSSKKDQKSLLEEHFQLALDCKLPLIFHVREAYKDFWPIFDNFPKVRGVLHSFTATQVELEQAIKRGLFIALNGIMTFTKNSTQLEAAKAIPKENLLLETDAPFLTPVPYRGKMCVPGHVRQTADFLATLRGEQLEGLAKQTSANAHKLFGL